MLALEAFLRLLRFTSVNTSAPFTDVKAIPENITWTYFLYKLNFLQDLNRRKTFYLYMLFRVLFFLIFFFFNTDAEPGVVG